MDKVKIKILCKCELCGGDAYFSAGEDKDAKGKTYMRYSHAQTVKVPVFQNCGSTWLNLQSCWSKLCAPTSMSHISVVISSRQSLG